MAQDNVATKSSAGEKAESLLGGIASIYKNASAANRAHELNEEARDVQNAANGKIRSNVAKTFDDVGDRAVDIANVLLWGIPRKFGNIFDDKDSKLDYKALKEAIKMAEVTNSSKVADRAQYLVNDNVANISTRSQQAEELVADTSSDESYDTQMGC